MPSPTLSRLCYRKPCIPQLGAWSQLFLSCSVGQSLCQVCNKNSSNMCGVDFQSGLVTPPPGRRGVGELKRLSHLASLLLGGWESSRGSPLPRVGPFWEAQPVLAGPSCLPRPPLGSVPVKLWSITRSLSRLLHIFALSVPPPPAS